MDIAFGILVFVLVVAGFGIWVAILVNGINAFKNIQKKHKLEFYMNPIGLFQSKYFTDEGNVYRRKMFQFVLYFMVMVILVALLAFYQSTLSQQ